MRDEATAEGTATVSSAVSLSVKFFPAHPAERFELNGKVKVVSTRCVESLSCVLLRWTLRESVSDNGTLNRFRVCFCDGHRERAYPGYIILAVLSWDLCLRGLSGW